MPTRTILAAHASAQETALRERTLWQQREDYPWAHTPGQPNHCKLPPLQELWTKGKNSLWDFDIVESLADIALATVLRVGKKNDTVESFRRYYPLRKIPGTAERWMADAEFGRQRLNGVNPYLIQCMRTFPRKFPVNKKVHREVIEAQLPGHSLKELLEAGRLFWVDYAPVDGITLVEGRFMVAPCALFWVDDRKQLMPLAIQLGQNPKQVNDVLFTPKDPHWTWLLARAHVACADAAYHEVAAHLLRTHMVGECFWVAAQRSLPSQHPVHQLLQPHFTSTIEVNYKARTQLIAPGGPIDSAIGVGSEGGLNLIAQEWAKYRFDAWHPREEFERRGVLDPDAMPHYWFRDDALRWFDALQRYVEAMLGLFYANDGAVQSDPELSAWAKELTSKTGANIPGLPIKQGTFRTLGDLCRVVTQLIYTVSVEHSAVNNGQYDQFGWIPNTPGALYLPPPTDHSPRSEANFVYALPPTVAVGEQLTLVHLLSEQTLHPMGQFDSDFFVHNERARYAIDRLRGDIATIDHEIRTRNQSLAVPYSYLLPEFLGRSIGT